MKKASDELLTHLASRRGVLGAAIGMAAMPLALGAAHAGSRPEGYAAAPRAPNHVVWLWAPPHDDWVPVFIGSEASAKAFMAEHGIGHGAPRTKRLGAACPEEIGMLRDAYRELHRYLSERAALPEIV